MKKKFKIENLHCANCAAKMEAAINKIEGVDECAVSFLTEKLILVADETVFDSVLEQAIKCMKKVEPDIKVFV